MLGIVSSIVYGQHASLDRAEATNSTATDKAVVALILALSVTLRVLIRPSSSRRAASHDHAFIAIDQRISVFAGLDQL